MGIDLEGLSLETFDLAKATTAGLTTGTGVFGYDLAGWVNLSPTRSEYRNKLPRIHSTDGNKFAIWRALTNLNAGQPNPATAFDFAGALSNIAEQDMQSPYSVIAVAGRVTQDSVDTAAGLGVDPNAFGRMIALNQEMIGEDKLLIGGQQFALPTPGTPVVTPATTGGTIGATLAINVRVAARTAENYFYGGSTVAGAQGTATSSAGTTNSAVATVTAVKGAVAYDWFVAGFYYTTTTVNKVTITSIPGANQALPTNLPELSTTAITSIPVADSSADPKAPNGLIASITGDYNAAGLQVTAGTGTSWGAPVTSLDGATLTLTGGSITEIDTLNLALWNSGAYVAPSEYMMNAQQASDIATKLTGSPGAVTFLQPSESGRHDLTGGAFVGGLINKAAGGVRVPVGVYSHIPPGTIIARTDHVDYQGSNIAAVHSVRTLRDYASIDYASNYNPGVAGGGPRQDFEVRTIESYINRAPGVNAMLVNVGQG